MLQIVAALALAQPQDVQVEQPTVENRENEQVRKHSARRRARETRPTVEVSPVQSTMDASQLPVRANETTPPDVRVPQNPPSFRIPILKVAPPADQRNSTEFTLGPVTTREFFRRTYKFPDNDPYWPCSGGARYDLSMPTSPQKVLTVGYKHFYESGTKPFPCATRVVEVHRGGARFDLKAGFNSGAWWLNPETVVERARLNFRRDPLEGGRECDDHLTTSAEAWPTSTQEWLGGRPWIHAILLPKDDSASCGGFGNICDVDVTGIVQEWVRGIRANNGFIFVGENEDMTARGNGACKTRYSSFELQMRVSWPVRR